MTLGLLTVSASPAHADKIALLALYLGSLSLARFVLPLGRVHAMVVRKRGVGTPAMEFPLPQSVPPFPYISLSQTAERLTFHPSIASKTLEITISPSKTTSLGSFSTPIAANFPSRRTSPWDISRRRSPPSRYSQQCQEQRLYLSYSPELAPSPHPPLATERTHARILSRDRHYPLV